MDVPQNKKVLHFSSLQADVLAQYKPTIDTKSLIAELKRSDKLAADGLVSFKKIRSIVLYYEDVVSNRTVRPLALYSCLGINQHLFLLITSILLSFRSLQMCWIF